MLLEWKYSLKAFDRILFQEPFPGDIEKMARYFGPYRLPGTTSIGLRKTRPDLFQDTENSPFETYPEWIDRTVRQTVGQLAPFLFKDLKIVLKKTDVSAIVNRIVTVLEDETSMGPALNEAIPQQMYEDVFIRMVLSIFYPGRRYRVPHLYREFNTLCLRLGLVFLDELSNGRQKHLGPGIEDFILMAVLSGHVGTNLKSTASAASVLLNRDRIPVPDALVRDMKTIERLPEYELRKIAGMLIDLAQRPEGRFGLDFLNAYHHEVVETTEPTLLIFFSDDYLESMIDMKRFELMVTSNKNLTVLFVPRCGRYGNDLAFEDMVDILKDRRFDKFQMLVRSGRIVISPHGPRAGCIDPRDVSASLLETIGALGSECRIILETKGCRNFEMLKGDLPIPCYASFNCNRALSIRTVGIDGPPVFLRIPPGLKAYDGFTQPRIAPSPSYRTSGVRFARMTTRQLCESLSSLTYSRLKSGAEDELHLNKRLQAKADALGITFPELLDMDRV